MHVAVPLSMEARFAKGLGREGWSDAFWRSAMAARNRAARRVRLVLRDTVRPCGARPCARWRRLPPGTVVRCRSHGGAAPGQGLALGPDAGSDAAHFAVDALPLQPGRLRDDQCVARAIGPGGTCSPRAPPRRPGGRRHRRRGPRGDPEHVDAGAHRLAAAVHARSREAHLGRVGARRRRCLPRAGRRRLAGPERPSAPERFTAASGRRPRAARRSALGPARFRTDGGPVAAGSRADCAADGSPGNRAGFCWRGAGSPLREPHQRHPGHAGPVRPLRGGRHCRLRRRGCEPGTRPCRRRPLPRDAVHPGDGLGRAGAGARIARTPRRAHRGGSAMTLRLPVLSGTIAPDDAIERTRAAPKGRLTIAEWLRFGPFLAQLVVTRRCNLSCGYCNEYDDHSPPVPFAALDERLLKLRELRTWVVCLTGGEPTLHPELVRIVARMRELRFRRRQLITNGYLLTPKLIEALNDAGLTDLQISVDGVKRNAVTVKVLDPLRVKLRELARRARFQVVVSAVIGSAPPAEALEVVRFARAHGLTPRIILLHDGSGRLNLSAEELATYREVKHLLGRAGRVTREASRTVLEVPPHAISVPFTGAPRRARPDSPRRVVGLQDHGRREAGCFRPGNASGGEVCPNRSGPGGPRRRAGAEAR